MAQEYIFIAIFLNLAAQIAPIHQPIGEEVVPGDVLLPATRRGRYLADIIRRQAVDGTGIKFNKDADRMNAEAKKHVDALSDELLPYVAAEQERRVTLLRRVMNAIQSGEHGVTVAEARGRPPVFIQRGKLFRCPNKLVPLEPDGSGVLGCENNVKPSQILYDACLDAEDAPLYYNDNTYYFFCNRHKDGNRISAAEMPRNDTHEFNCHPRESTSRDYTLRECTPEMTGDVVLHYRYYPDRTFKSVRELDPDGEVCENWTPCQIGYIFSLPPTETARPAINFFNPDKDGYEDDEFVPEITMKPNAKGGGGDVAAEGDDAASDGSEKDTKAVAGDAKDKSGSANGAEYGTAAGDVKDATGAAAEQVTVAGVVEDKTVAAAEDTAAAGDAKDTTGAAAENIAAASDAKDKTGAAAEDTATAGDAKDTTGAAAEDTGAAGDAKDTAGAGTEDATTAP